MSQASKSHHKMGQASTSHHTEVEQFRAAKRTEGSWADERDCQEISSIAALRSMGLGATARSYGTLPRARCTYDIYIVVYLIYVEKLLGS